MRNSVPEPMKTAEKAHIPKRKVIKTSLNKYLLHLRPGLFCFLSAIKPYYEIGTFTCASKQYAEPIIKEIEAAQLKNEVPELNVGDTVKVYGKIKEGNRERIQVFEGTVIKRQGGSNRETFTVRKSSNGVGVEKTWPLHSPNVEKIEVVRRGKVRRAKLNYLRDRVGKKAKVKELVR